MVSSVSGFDIFCAIYFGLFAGMAIGGTFNLWIEVVEKKESRVGMKTFTMTIVMVNLVCYKLAGEAFDIYMLSVVGGIVLYRALMHLAAKIRHCRQVTLSQARR